MDFSSLKILGNMKEKVAGGEKKAEGLCNMLPCCQFNFPKGGPFMLLQAVPVKHP